MEIVSSSMSDIILAEEGGAKIRKGGRRSRHTNDEPTEYKSKNLEAERRRRQKLSDRLLALRSLVPNITNMNKSMIIEDAITYIKELQRKVDFLKDQLSQFEESSEEIAEEQRFDEVLPPNDEINECGIQCGIQEDVQVTSINWNKFWIKIILQKKSGRMSRLIEGLNFYGFQLTDTSVTTFNGAFLVSSSVEGNYADNLTVQQAKDLLLQIIRSI